MYSSVQLFFRLLASCTMYIIVWSSFLIAMATLHVHLANVLLLGEY